MININIKCNNIARPVVREFDLTDSERKELDYINWEAVQEGSESFEGFRYRGEVYDLSEFEIASDDIKANGFDNMMTESAFSAVIVKFFDIDGNLIDNGDSVIIGYAHW